MPKPEHIRFACPTCARAVKAPAEAAGKKARCPGCQTQVTVPSPSTAPGTATSRDAAEKALRYQEYYGDMEEDDARRRAKALCKSAMHFEEDEAFAQRLKSLMDILYPTWQRGDVEAAEASREWKEIRRIGKELHQIGGWNRMIFVYHRMCYLRRGDDGCLNYIWEGIGGDFGWGGM